MNYLIVGGETHKRLDILISLTSIKGKGLVQALHDHYVVGGKSALVARVNGEDESNFNRAKKRLEEVAAKAEKLKEHDWAHFVKKWSGK